MVKRKAQSTVEYAVLAAVVVGALLVMQIYMKRGISGKFKESTDRVGEQYTPYTATYDLKTTLTGARRENTKATGWSQSTITKAEEQKQTGSEHTVNTNMGAEKLYGH